MTSNYGPGVSRVLDPSETQYTNVIFQQGKPPMDAEFVLTGDLASGLTRMVVQRGTPSGWLSSETGLPSDFVTDVQWSNWFKFGQQRTGELAGAKWAVVNGWLVPIMGTRTGAPPGSANDTATYNSIVLDPPPSNSGDFRSDFVFLEVWQARVAPNPSATNKPSSSTVYRYGNVEGGFSYLSDDLLDPSLGFETSQRVQLQYRIRVVKGLVGLTSNPDGFDPAIVKAKGAYDPTNPDTATSYTFQNMRQELGDPGLWRAGDGTANNLGTVDGYVYAIPIAVVFRRNGVAWSGDPSQNLNGAFNRNPTATARVWSPTTFVSSATTSGAMTAAQMTVTLTSVANLPLPSTPATPVLIQIGDELLTYSSIVGNTLNIFSRGVNGTLAEVHPAGSSVTVLSGRPDGLFADQIASTDILDLRHAVNPNGFDYQTLLHSNLDKLLRGELRANWKRSGAGPQGTFVSYQDKITAGSVALGVTKLDAPDRIRTVFSDTASLEPVELIVQANSAAIPATVNVAWGLSLGVQHTVRSAANTFSPNDVLRIPVNQLKAGLPGGDSDQVRWMAEGFEIRIDGCTNPLDPATYTITPSSPTSSDDLYITLQADFPATSSRLYIKAHVLYGAGRGLSRRPDAVHSLALMSPSTDILHTPVGVPATNYGLRTSLAVLWSKFQTSTYMRSLPVTAEAYVDPGSKTVILQPLQRLDMPDSFVTMDGTAANYLNPIFTGSNGSSNGTTTFTDSSPGNDFVVAGVTAGMALVISSGAQPGRYVIRSVTPTTLLLDRPLYITQASLAYRVFPAQGLMPLLKKDGVTPKWAQTDPLDLFSGQSDPNAATKNIYVTLPRHLVPTWGEYRTPILRADTAVFYEGINYMLLSAKGSAFADGDRNYVPYSNGALSYAAFSTLDLTPPQTNPAVYNATFTAGGRKYAGVRKFTDTRGLGRQGLELPPFYGIARLFGVYEALDYDVNGSPYDASSRSTGTGTAKNLLRQNFNGPLFWVEVDEDGDSTFILNADALDLSKSTTNPIASFATGNFVLEASIFGFDRGSFESNEFRLVLTRPTGSAGMRQQANNAVRYDDGINPYNIGVEVAAPTMVLPAPLSGSDSAVINYSRTPYGGDAWGSQTNYTDIGYNPGSLTSGIAYQLSATHLNESALTRPNQKVVQVLASIPFMTTAGTGRMGGYADTTGTLLSPTRNPGYEDVTAYPPTSPVAARPNFTVGGLAGGVNEFPSLSKYAGCTERLPLGALWRDKDFRGASLNTVPGSFITGYAKSLGLSLGLARASTLEATNIAPIPDYGNSEPGTWVHVDGEQGNYGLLTNYRTLRGGSVFCANDPNPGGEVLDVAGTVQPSNNQVVALCGAAYLVRNTPTNVGATEVSAGDELMMLIVTSVQRTFGSTSTQAGAVYCSTNGLGEGYSAADLYRIEGHPLAYNSVRSNLDPNTITLTFNSGLEG